MSREDKTYRENCYPGRGRANQFEAASHHRWQVDAREDNSDSKGLEPMGVVISCRFSPVTTALDFEGFVVPC
jgi:hypothetical protein